MSDCDQSIFCGYISKREILIRLKQYNIMTEENLAPIQNLRETQFINLDAEMYYKDLFQRHKQENDENSSKSSSGFDDSLNDTLSEMEALMSQGVNYVLGKSVSQSNEEELSFFPQISSTVTEDIKKVNSDLIVPNNSILSVKCESLETLTIKSSPDLTILKNMSSIKREHSSKSLKEFKVNNEKLIPPKINYISENNINSPDIFSSNNSPRFNKATPETKSNVKSSEKIKIFKNTPKNTKENNNPNSAQRGKELFKTPLPKLKQNYKNIVSPISRYISQSPSVPLIKKVVPKTVLCSEYNITPSKKTVKVFKKLPEVSYKPAKQQQLTYNERSSPLPKNIEKYIPKMLRPEIIKHKGRINVKNEFEEYFESYPIDVNVEDLSEFIDFETTRINEMSVMISSEAKFSKELN